MPIARSIPLAAFVLISALLFLSVPSPALCSSPSRSPSPSYSPSYRQNILNSTVAERSALFGSIVSLKQTTITKSLAASHFPFLFASNVTFPIPNPLPLFLSQNYSLYDCYVYFHFNFGIHRHSAFLPWHREMIALFENSLRLISGNPSISLMYWNWLDSPRFLDVFTAEFLGGNGTQPNSYLEDGPFADWPSVLVNGSVIVPHPIQRGLGARIGYMPTMPWMSNSMPERPKLADFTDALAISSYDCAPYDINAHNCSFRNSFEGWQPGRCTLHNAVHVWVGGQMRSVPVSPNDPVFYFHHAFVDKLYGAWQSGYWPDDPNGGYQPLSGGPKGQNADDLMFPFLKTVLHGAVPSNYAVKYQYEPIDEMISIFIQNNKASTSSRKA